MKSFTKVGFFRGLFLTKKMQEGLKLTMVLDLLLLLLLLVYFLSNFIKRFLIMCFVLLQKVKGRGNPHRERGRV